MDSPHIPVLLCEVLDAFSGVGSGVIVDCTLGYAGHCAAILESNGGISAIGCDKDEEAIDFSSKKLAKFGDRVRIYKSDFSEILSKVDVKDVRAILADIGVSSLQLDKNERGFSLKSDVLDMRMDKSADISAFDVVNSYSIERLTKIFKEYGELPNAAAIAERIAGERRNGAIDSGVKLAKIIGSKNIKGRGVNPAILAFQAIRIEVNGELAKLERLLDTIEKSPIDDCVVAIISFHSLEDRIVKNRFKKWSSDCVCPQGVMKCVCGANHAIGETVSKKAITASATEIKSNSRSACAKMRIFKISRKRNAR